MGLATPLHGQERLLHIHQGPTIPAIFEINNRLPFSEFPKNRKGFLGCASNQFFEVREEENPTMPTTAQTAPQLELVPNHGAQYHVVLSDQSADYLAPLIPIWAELKKLLESDYQKHKLGL